MKTRKRLSLVIATLFWIGMLIASQNGGGQSWGDRGLDFTLPPNWAGRPLTETEKATLRRAIDSIATAPPSAITYADSAGHTRTLSCATIAANLLRQLQQGRIEAETLNTGAAGETFYGGTWSDGLASTEGDELNLDTMMIVAAAEDSSLLKYLEVILVHEHTHKTQITAGTTNNAREVEAFAAGLAYMDSLGFESGDGMRQVSREAWYRHKYGSEEQQSRAPLLQSAGEYCAFLNFDTTGSGPSSLASFHLGQIGWHEYNLSPMRPSDMILFDRRIPVAAGHLMAVVCGRETSQGIAQLHAFDIFQGQVVSTVVTHSFGPPAFPPMSFTSMTRCPQTGLYFVLDTLNHQIRVLSDRNSDSVGDTIISIYACASWPGFELLSEMRGIDLCTHIMGGQVIVVNQEETHLPHQIDPAATCWVLPDLNGDREADLWAPAHGWEFVQFTPTIQVPLPVGGDQTVHLFATWMHNIEVWTSDSTGQNVYDILGSVGMASGADADCQLMRQLGEGEYIIPLDVTSGRRPNLATRVGSPSSSDETRPLLPDQFSLAPPFPNPFNASTTIRFDLPALAVVSLRIYDLLGREVITLISGAQSAGQHSVTWNATDAPSGLYFVRLDVAGSSRTQKMMLIR